MPYSTLTMKALCYPYLLLALLSGIEVSNATPVTSSLQVHIPPSLTKDGGYSHSDALFGIPPYGGTIQAQVYYSSDDFCAGDIDAKGGYPARADKSPWASPFILMIDRGACSFVTKVRTAQRMGAAAVLVADWECVCGVEDCVDEDESAKCQQTEPIMSDDGSGLDISVPSFLVAKNDADTIKNALVAGTQVRVEMAFSIPAPDSRAEYSLWFRPRDPQTNSFLKSFKKAAVALGDSAYFTPHFYVYSGEKAGCVVNGENLCEDFCTNQGRYCSSSADVIRGSEIVEENLRRICIWKVYGQEDGVGQAWWDYMDAFMDTCDVFHKAELFFSEECILSAMQAANVDPKAIETCMTESGGVEANVTNPLLEQEILAKDTAGIILIPSVYVNKAPVRGELEFATIFKAVCAGYATGFQPEICHMCANCPDEESCVASGGKCTASGGMATSGGGDVTVATLLASLAAVVVVMSVIGIWQYNRQQQHMRSQVRGILAEYMPLEVNQNQKPVNTSAALEQDEGSEMT